MSRTGSLLARGPSAPGASNRTGRPDRLLRVLAVSVTATTFLLVGIGGLVRATGSGLGCPGWPRCFGRWVPPLEHHAVIEYTHRLVAAVTVVLIGTLAVVAWRRYRDVPKVFVPATVALVVVVLQAGLGAVVVEGELAALLVTAHFATAMVLVAVVVLVTVGSHPPERPSGPPVVGLTRMARAAAGATFALLIVGAYVRGEGAGRAFGDWPLMDGRPIPRLGTLHEALHFSHRLLALAVVVLVVALAARASRAGGPVATLAWIAAGLLLAQAAAGAVMVWTGLAPTAIVAHVTLAAMTWGAVVATAAVSRGAP
jgi:cytochrome c oxidase assembly protein subunit 15